MKCYVFAYGTLRDAKVRKEVIGYDTSTCPASLKGYSKESIVIDQLSYPVLVEDNTADKTIQGEIFEIDPNDLVSIDLYETTAYRRKLITLESGLKAWVYIK